jgi:hypothetical protein
VIDHDPAKTPSPPAAKSSSPAADSSPAESPDRWETPEAKPHQRFRAGFTPTITPNGAGGTFTFTGSTPNYSAGDVSIAGHATVSGSVLVEGGSVADVTSAYPEIAQDAIQRNGDPNSLVEKAELVEPTLTGDVDLLQKEMNADLSVGVRVKWRGGQESHGTLHVAQAALTSKGVTGSVMSLELRHSIPIVKLQSQWRGLKVSGEVRLDVSLTLTPNWLSIARKVIPRLAQTAVAAAEEGAASEALGGMVAAEAAIVGGALLGAYITIKALQASLEDWDDMRKVARAAERAVQGYAGGFSAAMGGKNVDGDANYHAQGAADGARMFKSSVAALVEASGNGLTEDEARARIQRFCAANPDKIYDAVYARVYVPIKETFVQGWKSSLTLWQRLFTKIETHELMLRTLMGLKAKQGEDEPSEASEPSEPSPSRVYTGARASPDPVGDSMRAVEKTRKEQAGQIQGQLPQAQGRANFTGSRLAAWIRTNPKPQAINAHNRGQELWRTANADAAKVPKNASTEDLESWGHVAVVGYDAATAAFKEGLALYPSGDPPKPKP